VKIGDPVARVRAARPDLVPFPAASPHAQEGSEGHGHSSLARAHLLRHSAIAISVRMRSLSGAIRKQKRKRPSGPIPLKSTGRSFTLDDVDAPDEAEVLDIDDFATSKPQGDDEEEGKE
jgi:hypothetical protein